MYIIKNITKNKHYSGEYDDGQCRFPLFSPGPFSSTPILFDTEEQAESRISLIKDHSDYQYDKFEIRPVEIMERKS